MASRYLIDSNILVYALDHRDINKQQRARQVLRALKESGSAAISTQVLAEFFITLIRNLPDPLPLAEAYIQIEAISETYRVIEVSRAIVLEAARGLRDYQFHYWDAQIWATAKLNQIPFILTEDLPGKATLEGVRFLNPFSKEFDISSLE